ncbi:glycosyltransferase family 61 protein [Leclercia adecarboxylata]|uniref:glycosyltransferase family 61 protein n=1 Tax=Leclercia adecarboxylata TaxID=83655 RepID=UPI001E5F00D5|nr:glycosyltransferase family 61 protein [Leclercia adecarboxylata]MDU1651251.1 glycosyltransferase family 61 protein [Leclercia adecarboxylata]MDU2021134.1 glycosyltransferase family 61 protein [Leclercia adecarboxylata]UFM70110.1 glycosyltransferase family 61 protein [Leclercia adecarboxylata]
MINIPSDIKQWINAKKIGFVSTPSKIHHEHSFKLIRGASAAQFNNQAFLSLENDLYKNPVESHSILLQDCFVYGCGFIVQSQGEFIHQSRYLNPDVEPRIKNSLRSSPNELDSHTVWICGCNASVRNYWHWHAQSLPAILHCIDFIKSLGITKYGIIVPKLTSWQKTSLDALNLETNNIIEVSIYETVFAKNLVMSELMYSASPYDASIYRKQVRDFILSSAKDSNTVFDVNKINISRKDSKRRPMLNEDKLSKELELLGYTTLVMSELSYFEQVIAFNSAENIVCQHGAGTTNALFCERNASILELQLLNYPNSGPASLLKTNGATIYADVFDDDGYGAATLGWNADINICLETVSRMS